MAYRELTEGFELNQDEKGITATRIFLWNVGEPSPSEAVQLPVIGEQLNLDLSNIGDVMPLNVYCRNRAFRFIAGDINTYQVVCTYSNEPIDGNAFADTGGVSQDPASIPQNVEYTGEYQVFEPPEDTSLNKWQWLGSTDSVDVPVYFRVRTSNIRYHRIIPQSSYAAFQSDSRFKIGTVNASEFEGYGPGCLLYTGYSSEKYFNHEDKISWRVELTFSYRDPDGLNVDGWQKILRKTGKWDIPENKDTSEFMYEVEDFNILFS